MLWQQQHDRNRNQSFRYKVVSIQIQYKLKQWNYCHYFKYSLCQMKNDPCSCECNLCNCMWSLKKFRTSTGFKPVDLAIPLQRSNQLLKLWSHPTYSNPVEVLNFSQASLHNCINCVHCDNHFFIFISFPQFIYDLFHISLALKPLMLGASHLCVHMFLWKRWMWQMYQIKSCMRYVKLFTPWLNQLVSKLLVAKWLCIKKTSNNRQSACNKGFTLCSAADDVCITTVSLTWLCLVVVASFQLFAFYAVSTPGVQITNCVPYKGF